MSSAPEGPRRNGSDSSPILSRDECVAPTGSDTGLIRRPVQRFGAATLAYDTCGFRQTEETLEELVRRLRRLGYGGVCLNLDRRHLHPHEHDAERVAAVRELLERAGMSCVVATDDPLLWGSQRDEPSPIADHPSQRRMWRLFHEDAIDVAGDLGATCLTVRCRAAPSNWMFGQIAVAQRRCMDIHIREALGRQRTQRGRDLPRLGRILRDIGALTDDDVDAVLDEQERRLNLALNWLRQAMGSLCERGRSRGVRVALDFGPGLLLENIEHFQEFTSGWTGPAPGLVLDVCALLATSTRTFTEELAACADQVAHVRLSDVRRRVFSRLPLGEGDLDVAEVLSALSGAGYAGQVAVHYRTRDRRGGSAPQHLRRGEWELAEQAIAACAGARSDDTSGRPVAPVRGSSDG